MRSFFFFDYVVIMNETEASRRKGAYKTSGKRSKQKIFIAFKKKKKSKDFLK